MSEYVLETESLTFMRICFISGLWDQDNPMMLSEAGLLAEPQPALGGGCSRAGLHLTRLAFWSSGLFFMRFLQVIPASTQAE